MARQKLTYPTARKGDVVDDYHGTPVADPYRWLEDPDAPETTTWVAAENRMTFEFIRGEAEGTPQGAPGAVWEQLKARLTQLWNYPKFDVLRKEGPRYFFWKNDGLQNQHVLCAQDTPDAASEGVPVLDPNSLSEDGTAAVSGLHFSHDGRLLAYGVSRSGSDWQEIHVRAMEAAVAGATNTSDGPRSSDGTEAQADLPDVIKWCKFAGIAWKPDSSGFFYNRFPEPGSVPPEDQSNFQKVFWHRLGTSQAEDTLIYERPDAKELGLTPFATDDGAYLLLHVWRGTEPRNRVYYRPMPVQVSGHPEAAAIGPYPVAAAEIAGASGTASSAPGAAADQGGFVRLLDEADAKYWFIDNAGPVFYFQTDLDAPNGRVVAIDLARPERASWREVVAEGPDAIDHVAMVNNHLVVVTLHDAHHEARLYTLEGQHAGDVALPTVGTIGGLTAQSSGLTGRRTDSEMFLGFTSYLYPLTTFRYDFATRTLERLRAPLIRFDPALYETKQVFYTSKDGTRVPMFLTHKKGLTLDGRNPTLLYGYGGFNVSLTPGFTASRLVWLEQGGVFAVANLRGGAEYGKAWHEGGILDRKQNVFDDFIAAAEWLIQHGYTSRSRLVIQGGSNGGLLVAACMTQRPELFGAVLCQVPVADMLRYHRFTVGRYWVTDYGNAEESAEHFRFLYAYSPLHNVRTGTHYPPTLITSADTDDRVVPAHAKKLAATLQAAHAGDNPVLIRVETRAGHGAGKPTSKIIEEQADLYSFVLRALRLDYESAAA